MVTHQENCSWLDIQWVISFCEHKVSVADIHQEHMEVYGNDVMWRRRWPQISPHVIRWQNTWRTKVIFYKAPLMSHTMVLKDCVIHKYVYTPSLFEKCLTNLDMDALWNYKYLKDIPFLNIVTLDLSVCNISMKRKWEFSVCEKHVVFRNVSISLKKV